jgi:hypothetical protein
MKVPYGNNSGASQIICKGGGEGRSVWGGERIISTREHNRDRLRSYIGWYLLCTTYRRREGGGEKERERDRWMDESYTME